MIQFYMNEKKRMIDPLLFSDKAATLAKEIYEAGLGKPDKNGRRKLSKNMRSQIRKFYDEVLQYNLRANDKTNPVPWHDIHPYINMLVAKAAYAEGRDKVSHNFTDFIKNSIGQINNPEDLLVFANYFEAMMGFYRQYDK